QFKTRRSLRQFRIVCKLYAHPLRGSGLYFLSYHPEGIFMMSAISRFSILVSLIFLVACTNTRYGNDFKSGTDFTNLKTYQWRSVTVDIGGTDQQFMQRLADDQLQIGRAPCRGRA